MKKTDPDGTDFAATFTIPDNVRAQVDDIVQRSHRTYPDHGESRVMIQQELINALSERTKELKNLADVAVQLADQTLTLHTAIAGLVR
jgi:hypothetical protein